MTLQRRYKDVPFYSVEVIFMDGTSRVIEQVMKVSTSKYHLTLMIQEFGSYDRFKLTDIRYFKVII